MGASEVMVTSWKPSEVVRERSSPRAGRRNRAVHAKLRPTAQRRGSGTKPRLASASLTTSRRIPWSAASRAGSAPVYPWST